MKPTPGIAEDHPCGGSFVGFRVSAFPGGIALNARITKSLMISRPASSSSSSFKVLFDANSDIAEWRLWRKNNCDGRVILARHCSNWLAFNRSSCEGGGGFRPFSASVPFLLRGNGSKSESL